MFNIIEDEEEISHISRLNTKNLSPLELSDFLMLLEQKQSGDKDDSIIKKFKEFMEKHQERTIRNINRLDYIIKNTAEFC